MNADWTKPHILASVARAAHEGTRFRVKDTEKAEIYATVIEQPGISRKAIVDRTGNRPSTVSSVVQELIDDGLVAEQLPAGGDRPNGPAGKGRPEIALRAVPDRLRVISTYTVWQELRASVIDLSGAPTGSDSIAIAAGSSNAEMVEAVSRMAVTLRDRTGAAQVLGVALSLPGFVNKSAGRWMFSARWPNVRNLDVASFEQTSNMPFRVERWIDADLEYLMLANPELSVGGTLLVHWGYGVGAAYAQDGSVFRSKSGGSLEIGHWRVSEAIDTVCTCGSVGCLETVAGLWSLAPAIRAAIGSCPEDEDAFGAFIDEQPVADLEPVVRAATVFSENLAKLVSVFFPERVILFGPFFRDRKISDRVVETTAASLPTHVRESIETQVLEDGISGTLYGAAIPFFRRALRDLLTARW